MSYLPLFTAFPLSCLSYWIWTSLCPWTHHPINNCVQRSRCSIDLWLPLFFCDFLHCQRIWRKKKHDNFFFLTLVGLSSILSSLLLFEPPTDTHTTTLRPFALWKLTAPLMRCEQLSIVMMEKLGQQIKYIKNVCTYSLSTEVYISGGLQQSDELQQ